MLKPFLYFIQSLLIYFFFLVGKLLGLKTSRKIFSFIFLNIAPIFKSKKIIDSNLKIFNRDLSDKEKKIN